MIIHNIEAEKVLMVLPEGTAVTVDGIVGKLIFHLILVGLLNTFKRKTRMFFQEI